MSNELFLFFLVAAIQVIRVAALNVVISPHFVRVNNESHTINFTCAADSALAKCQFKWWDGHPNAHNPLMDLSRGPQSQADPAHLDGFYLNGYSYTGRGLGAGDCGVSLQVEFQKQWIVSCRVQAETGGWKYAWADLVTDFYHGIPHHLTPPREVVVLPGGEARITVKTQGHLRECGFYRLIDRSWLWFDEGAASKNSTGRHLYLGAGLESGECGLAMTDITKADNGPLRIYISAQGYNSVRRLVPLIVARPPPAPTISLVYTGTNLTATCIVGNCRPVANISWILGDKVIRQGESDDSQAGPNDTWRWPWMEGSYLQTLTLQLKPEDQGQVLKCVVSHVALAQPHEARAIISMTGATSATP